jgi:hypothetical protein
MLIDADFAGLKDKEIAFYYGGKWFIEWVVSSSGRE